MTGSVLRVLTPAEAFAFLLGDWRLEREIPGQAVAAGVLTVAETMDGAAEYRERVVVRTTTGAEFSGSQRYLVKRLEDGFVLCFAETGAIFEEVRFTVGADCGPGLEGSLRAEAAHQCGEDWYRSTYVLGPGRRFTIRHAVSGPRKEYVSETTFCAMG